MERQDSGRTKAYNNAFHSYVNDCYFEVKITEQISGVTKTLKIRFDDTVVTGVDVNQNSMVF